MKPRHDDPKFWKLTAPFIAGFRSVHTTTGDKCLAVVAVK